MGIFSGISVRTKLILSWSIAVLIAVGNHFFFAFLNGKNTQSFKDSSITLAKNTIATAFQLAIAFLLSSVLGQVTWHNIRDKPIKVSTLDNVLGLPKFGHFTSLAFSHAFARFPPLIAITIFFLSLSLITIFVPASLSIGPATSVEQSINVPVFTMSTNHSEGLAVYDWSRSTSTIDYGGPTPLLRRLAETTIGLGKPVAWTRPNGCAIGCQYTVVYSAPVLKCSLLTREQIWKGGVTDGPMNSTHRAELFDFSYSIYTFNGTYTARPPILPFSSQRAPLKDYAYVIAYDEWRALEEAGSPSATRSGVVCNLYNGTYTVDATFSGTEMETKIASMEKISEEPISDWNPCPHEMLDQVARECDHVNFNTEAIFTAFSDAMSGTVGLINNVWDFNATYPIASLFSTDVSGAGPSNSFGLSNRTLEVGLDNALQELFGNMTVSLMSPMIHSDSLIDVRGQAIPFANQYHYDLIPLLVVYGGVIAASLGCVIYALIALKANGGREMGADFSKLLVVTRGRALDELAAKGDKEIKKAKVVFGAAAGYQDEKGVKRRGFTVVGDDSSWRGERSSLLN